MIIIIDIGHPPRKPDLVERELQDAIEKVRNSPTSRIVKVVHGNGAATRTTVRNWAYRTRQSIRATISGENYNLFDTATQEMRSECGQYSDPDLGRGNKGITIIWVK
jgi:hypothetical protein